MPETEGGDHPISFHDFNVFFLIKGFIISFFSIHIKLDGWILSISISVLYFCFLILMRLLCALDNFERSSCNDGSGYTHQFLMHFFFFPYLTSTMGDGCCKFYFTVSEKAGARKRKRHYLSESSSISIDTTIS